MLPKSPKPTNPEIKIKCLSLPSVNSALLGELPSFGMAKESKFQQLMQRNQAMEAHGNQQAPVSPQDMQNFKLDTSLSVEAKAFQPTSGYKLSLNIDAYFPCIDLSWIQVHFLN